MMNRNTDVPQQTEIVVTSLHFSELMKRFLKHLWPIGCLFICLAHGHNVAETFESTNINPEVARWVVWKIYHLGPMTVCAKHLIR